MPKKEKEEKKTDKGSLIWIPIVIFLAVFTGIFFVKLNADKCPEGILPDKILMLESQKLVGHSYEDRYVVKTSKWADGVAFFIRENSSFAESFEPDCSRGIGDPENASLFYCRDAVYISEKRNMSYAVKLVVKPIDTEIKKEQNILVSRVYRNYTLVSARCIKQQ